ncbi:hypothetical protein A3C37_02870 [Candidatus Peribacteria bacterium RIFCSPHIGHO2_02_FULL_53_20]|nr:MAG: hypothetical protein A3C37_02870 [Candidatus Peribacteria bacterium RIFCSPHIGHO2_02_FULL_53_20]OGJ66992.1 MAG: hypothetical protein A3B61_00745 [Candidatus Peribacteria bacterium RIFCSPLOWO2_01_FULL_53_10]OGJ69449.1 MAG: hypothetical protein A3G69_04035 [Candidatus Peribacteria bacterium RIFCSPLOWO2_12_FULL_53_10]
MLRSEFPADYGEKLSLEEPDLWDINDFKGHKRMAVARGNAMLSDIFETRKTDLPKLIAAVRWSLCQMPFRDYAHGVGLSPNGYSPMEKDMKKEGLLSRYKYTLLLRDWEQRGISLGIREQMIDVLTAPHLLQMDETCTDLLSSIEYIRNQSKHLLGVFDMNAFYHRIGVDRGHEEVEKSFPHLFNTIWQREQTDTVPDCLEVISIVDAMYGGKSKCTKQMHALRKAQGLGVWSEVQKWKYRESTVERTLADFLVGVERDLALRFHVPLTAKALQDHYGFGPHDAQFLIQCEWIDPASAEKAVRQILPPRDAKKLLQGWSEEYAEESKRETFGKLASAAMEDRGYTAADVAELLGLKAPEERGKDTVERKQRYRPDAEVRGVLFENHVSKQISVEALIQVIARDEDHLQRLRKMYADYRTRFFRRNGATLEGKGLQMRTARELANVTMHDLALHFLPKKLHDDRTAVRKKDLELQKLERDEGSIHPIRFSSVFRILEQISAQRVEEAMARVSALDIMDESLKQFSTVREMASNLVVGLKGANKISDAMRDIARNDSEWLRSDLITKMAEGAFVSALPPLRVMTKSTIDKELPAEVVRDWHERFPEQLQKGLMGFGKVTRPIARVLCTLIARIEAEPMQFYQDRVPGIVPTHGTKHLRDLDAGYPVDWRYIHKALLGAGIPAGHPSYVLVKELYDNGGNLAAALLKVIPILQDAGEEIHPLNLQGLTFNELKPFQKTNKKSPKK